MFERILAAVDGSENGWKALDFACQFHVDGRTELIVAHAVMRQRIPDEIRVLGRLEHLPEPYDQLHYDAIIDGLAGAARQRAADAGVREITWIAEFGEPAEVILQIAERRDVDLIVMGRRGLGNLDRLLLGSVAHKVSNLAACTCATVRR